MNVEVRIEDGETIISYCCSNCNFRGESREELQGHLDSSYEMPDVDKLLTMDVEPSIQYILKFPNW